MQMMHNEVMMSEDWYDPVWQDDGTIKGMNMGDMQNKIK